jgi:hypothetical protein
MILAAGFVAKEFESVSGQLLDYYYFTYFSLVSSCSGDMIPLVVVNVVTFSSFSVNKSKEKL